MPQRNEKMTDTQKITDKVSQEPEIIDNSKLNNLIINGRKITVDSRTLANIFCRESNNADQYFNLITKVVYNAILVTNPKASKIREQLTTIQLSILSTAELIAAKVLKESMELELPYKEIFKQVKSSLNSIPMSKTEVLGA